jgi:essential nuclear protein 1
MGLLQILGLTGHEGAVDWEKALEKKLKEVEEKSLDNPEVKRVYGEIGKLFSRYRSGKVPKAFKIIPNLEHWREVLAMTRPEQWTSQAMAQAVNIFASNFDPVRAEEFYKTCLVPAVRRDLANNKKLNVHLYDSLKKAMYKTNAWFKGIMFEMCTEETLMRETKVVESLLSKMSIPVISASVAMLKLMDVTPTTPSLHYLAALLNKHYTLPKRVLSRLVEYLLSFKTYEGELSVVWQGILLTLAKQYSQSLDEMSKAALQELAREKNHKLITPEILQNLA